MGKAFRPEDVVFYFEGRITQATARSLGPKGKKSGPIVFRVSPHLFGPSLVHTSKKQTHNPATRFHARSGSWARHSDLKTWFFTSRGG